MVSREFQDALMPPVFYKPHSGPEACFEKPPGLAVAAIVKNEANYIEAMLRSAVPLASYFVVADTGSSDETKAIAEATLKNSGIPFTLADITFDHFSQARNAALALVPSNMSWVLMLDADEILVAEDYPLFLPLLSNEDVDAWGLPRYNFTDPDKIKPVQSYPSHMRRLLRNRVQNPVRYSGRVHEDVVAPFRIANVPANTLRFSGTAGGPHIHHIGCIGRTDEETRKRSWFYANLAEGEDSQTS